MKVNCPQDRMFPSSRSYTLSSLYIVYNEDRKLQFVIILIQCIIDISISLCFFQGMIASLLNREALSEIGCGFETYFTAVLEYMVLKTIFAFHTQIRAQKSLMKISS